MSENQKKPKMDNIKLISIKNLELNSENWCIEGKLVSKSGLIPYSNDNGKGERLSFVLTDETGIISCIAFQNEAHTLEKQLELNKMYIISNASIKSNKYNNKKIDLRFTKNTKVELKEGKAIEIKDETNFIKINDIKGQKIDDYISNFCFFIVTKLYF